MSLPSGWELVLVVLVIVLLFGARKLPDAARGLGRSLRIFKAEVKDPNDSEGRDLLGDAGTPAAQQPVITAAQVPPATPVVPVQQVQPVQPYQPVPPPQYQPVPPPAAPYAQAEGGGQQPVQQGQQTPTER